MNLCVVSLYQDVSVHVSLRGMLLHVVAKSGDDNAVLALHMTIGTWMVARCDVVLETMSIPRVFATMLKEP